MTHHNGTIEVFRDTNSLAARAAALFADLAQHAIAERGRFSVALSGGSTPKKMYQLLAAPPLCDTITWPDVHVFWGDERYVAPDDDDSTYKMTGEALLAHVPLPAANIYLVPTIGGTPESTAASYEQTIRAFFGDHDPAFDLILLGMGPDGHTASLFPGLPAAAEPTEALVLPVDDAPKPPPTRITFTFPLINQARQVVFLIAGADKAATLQQVLHGPVDPAALPAQGVRPTNGSLIWLIDEAAAAELDPRP